MAWAGTPVQASSSVPLMATDGLTAINTAAQYRQGLIGAFVGPAPGGVPRSGVIVSYSVSGSPTVAGDLLCAAVTPTANANVTVAPGACVIERSGLAAGPYLAEWNQVSTVAIDPGASTNPRIDFLYAQLTDNAIGDSGTQGAALKVVDGTPSASPVAPSLPTGGVPIAQILRPVNATTVTTSNITMVRHSAGGQNGVRVLLEADLLGDPGSYNGEFTFDYITPQTAGLRYWDGGTWRGVKQDSYMGSRIFAPGYNLSWGTGPSPNYNILTCPISDPGFPYRMRVSGKIGGSNLVGQVAVTARLDDFIAGPVIGLAYCAVTGIWEAAITPCLTASLTGNHTAQITLTFLAANQSCLLSQSSSDYYLNVDVLPA